MHQYSEHDVTLAAFVAFALLFAAKGSVELSAVEFSAAFLELTVFALLAIRIVKFIENSK